ncbi:MAG: TM2 domain-containing protein [Bacteroidaceae bacterium]|nr:TM2 domain-containing protein [Bacteroidaceae bacterium]MDO4993999.1 TM2 domain-containing protein [Bacteroidales bacterium]
MDQQKVDMYLATNGKYFPEDKLPFLRDALLQVDDSRWTMLQTLQMKDPLTLLLISIFLGECGVDRFMLDEIGLGILKLLTAGGCGVWWLVDLFLIQDKAKEFNYKKLQAYIG